MSYLIPIVLFDLRSSTELGKRLTYLANSAFQKFPFRATRYALKSFSSPRFVSARFASDSTLHGKIHQVIGAVVDGK